MDFPDAVTTLVRLGLMFLALVWIALPFLILRALSDIRKAIEKAVIEQTSALELLAVELRESRIIS